MEKAVSGNSKVDEGFYDRADSLINVANEHCSSVGRGKVSASFMYATARFNAWVSACGFESADEMNQRKAEAIEYFVAQYKTMLEENLDDYIAHFDRYMRAPKA